MKLVRVYALLFVCLGFQRVSAQLTVNVPAGGDVVGAASQVYAAGGGTINLAAGNYYITGSIVLGSNTTLNGAGGPGSATQSVIYAPQTPNGIAMVYGNAGSQNIAISNLVLDGNIPQAAMLYGTGNGNYAYNDTGIYVYSQSATTVGMTITNVEVRHTLRGILTGLVDNLTISGCYFHDNNPGGFSHNMYLVATSGVEIDHTRSNNALLGDGLHIDFGGTFYTIRKSEFTGNDGLGLLSQEDNNVTVEDTKLDFNNNEGIQINAAGLLLTRDESSYNGGYGLEIPSTPDSAGVVNGYYSIQNDPAGVGGDNGADYVYGASLVDFTEGNPGPNAYPAIRADGVIGVADTGDWTLNYGGYTYLGAVDFNANHLRNGSITFQVGNAVATGPYPLVIRYSNGTSGNQTMNLSVNGGTAVAVNFPSTGSYTTWATVTVNQTLLVGNNAVTLSVPTGATSAPELDLLTVTAATPPAPSAPTNVTGVANGPYSVTLTWTPPANSNGNAAQTYNIYKNNRVPIVATKITGTTWTDTRIFYGETTNQYFVTAVNQGGESGASNTVTVTTGIDAPPGLQVSVVPSKPANNLNWLGVSGAAIYLVKRATVSGGPYQTIATVSASTNTQYPSYSDTSLSTGQTYYYVVAAEDSNNNVSANSYEVKALSQTFTLAAASPSINVSTATAATGSITVNGTNGFSDQVSFAVTGLPTGVTASFSPASASSGGSTQLTLTDSTSSPATLGSYPLTVTGTDGGLTSSIALTLNIGLTQTITFNAVPPQAVGNTFTPSATASSGLPVSFTVVPNGNCSTTGTTVTFLNAGACGIVANQTGNATYGAAATVGQVVQVNSPQSQTITFAAIAGQTAGGTVPLNATASSGLPVSFASVAPSVCTVSGSSASLLTGGTCSIVASQAGGGAYGPAPSVEQSFTVASNLKSQTITFNSIATQTAGNPLALTATASSGLTVSYASSTPTVCTVSGSTASLLAAGTCTLTASQSGNSSYSAATSITQSFTVSPAATFTLSLASSTITLLPNNGLADALTVNPLNGFTAAVTLSLSGLPTGVSASFYPSNPTTSSTNLIVYVPTGTAPGSYPLTVTGVSGSLTVSTPVALIVQGTQTITFAAIAGQTAGGSLTLNATASSGLAVSFSSSTPTVCTVSGSTASLLTAGTCTVTAAQAGNTVYTAATPVTQSFTVAPKAQSQTITFNAISTQTSGTSLALTATASSGLAVSYASSTPGVCTVSGSTASLLAGGTCTLTASQAGNSSYSAATAVSQSFTVLQSQTITFNAIPAQALGNSLTLMATASSGLPVTFVPVPNGNCSVSGNVVTFLNTGNCGINATQAGNASYAAAPPVGQIIVVNNPSSQTITFAAIASQTVGTSVALSATASSGLTVSFASSTPSVCTVSGSTASLLAAGTCTIKASQAGGGAYGPATSVSQSFTVLQSQTITFNAIATQHVGTPLNVSGYATASSGLPITWTLVNNGNCSISGTTVTFINPGACGIIANQAGNATYAAAAAVGQVVQVAGPLQSQTITFKTIATQKVGTTLNISGYATASSGLTVTYTYVNNGNCTVSGTTVSFLATGSCGIIANQAGNGTYAAAAAVGQVVQVSN